MRKIILAAIGYFVLAGTLTAAAPIGNVGTAMISGPIISANLNAIGYTIPSNFVGWSAELSDVVVGGIYTGTSPLIPLVKLLGPNGILRVGGNAQDTNPAPAVTQQQANDLKAFLTALGPGWSMTYGLDLGIDYPPTAVQMAGYVINAFGVGNVTFSIGNEPNIYVSQPTYVSRWNTYYSALVSAYPGIRMVSAEATLPLDNSQLFNAGLTLNESQLAFVTQHFYPLAPSPRPTVDAVLATIGSYNWTVNTAYAPNKMFLDETSMIYLGGLTGLSDALLADAWYTNLAINLANNNWQSLNNHSVIIDSRFGGNGAPYNPFLKHMDGKYSATPFFYAMYLFSKIEGQQTVSNSVSGASLANAVAISTKGSNGNANIVVANNQSGSSITFSPDQSKPWKTAQLLLISGSSCTDTAPTIGGAVIGEDGVWSGGPTTINYGDTVSIPACGAALIQIQP